MNLNKLDVKNKNTNLYYIFYILFIQNKRKTKKKLITEKITFPTVFIPRCHEPTTTAFLWSRT
jgi:hypothetical protein